MTLESVVAHIIVYVGVAVCAMGVLVAFLAVLSWAIDRAIHHWSFYTVFVEFLFERQKQRRNRSKP